jgi:hypothetical protein
MTQTQPMSNLQAELLKLYANNISQQHLLEIRLLLGKYFAQKATDAMEKVWESQQLTEQDMVDWSNEHNRYAHRS